MGSGRIEMETEHFGMQNAFRCRTFIVFHSKIKIQKFKLIKRYMNNARYAWRTRCVKVSQTDAKHFTFSKKKQKKMGESGAR